MRGAKPPAGHVAGFAVGLVIELVRISRCTGTSVKPSTEETPRQNRLFRLGVRF